MNKKILASAILIGLIVPQARAAESGASFGVGAGALYSGLGVNVGLKTENDFRYVSAGCLAIGRTSVSGWILPCGIGVGWIWTGLLSKDDNRHGFGLYAGSVDVDKRGVHNGGEARYGLGLTYSYFPRGIGASGWSFGLTPAVHVEDGSARGSVFLNVGYQF